MPLKYSDLVDDIELRKRIEIWIDQKKKGLVTDEEVKENKEKERQEKEKKDMDNFKQPLNPILSQQSDDYNEDLEAAL